MEFQVTHKCAEHSSPFECPDSLAVYVPKFDEYGLIIHDGGTSKINIAFCPWCGTKLPSSKRDRWFEELEKLGFTEPFEQDIPEKYLSDAWFRF